MRKSCPSPDQLRRLLDDDLPEPQETSIGNHVERCDSCQASLERLTGSAVGPGPSRGGRGDEVDVDPGFLLSLKSAPPPRYLRDADTASGTRPTGTQASAVPPE